MKLSLIAVLFASLATACASAPPPPAVPVVVEVEPPRPVTNTVERSSFKVTLPGDWIVRSGDPIQTETSTRELIARGQDPSGNMKFGVVVDTVALAEDDIDDEQFGLMALIALSRSGMADRVQGMPRELDGVPGSFALAISDDVIVVQAAAAHNRKGFILQCGGPASQGDTVLKTCRPIVESFRIKK